MEHTWSPVCSLPRLCQVLPTGHIPFLSSEVPNSCFQIPWGTCSSTCPVLELSISTPCPSDLAKFSQSQHSAVPDRSAMQPETFNSQIVKCSLSPAGHPCISPLLGTACPPSRCLWIIIFEEATSQGVSGACGCPGSCPAGRVCGRL